MHRILKRKKKKERKEKLPPHPLYKEIETIKKKNRNASVKKK